ncbi:MAG: hypothetical protein ACREFE_08240 [Limisphaerales bacterium]
MSEEQQPHLTQPAPTKSPGARRRGRRGGRGRRLAPPPPAFEQSASAELPPPQLESSAIANEFPPQVEPPKQKFQPTHPAIHRGEREISAISQAVNEVMQIVGSLRQTLEQMEEVLELVELAERQKLTDEREIESLLRALRQLQSRGGRPDRQQPND